MIIKIVGKEGTIQPITDLNFSSTDRVSEREINHRFCDSSLAQELIGYKPQVTLAEGIQNVINSDSITRQWGTREKDYVID